MKAGRFSTLFVLLAFLVACSATTRHKVLSVVFDGVPPREPAEEPAKAILEVEPRPAATATTATRAPRPATRQVVTPAARAAAPPTAPEEPEPTAAELAERGFAVIDELPLRPVPKRTGESWTPADVALENASTWEEALALLPLDVAGGVDWVAAVENGLTVPQLVLDIDATAPYTLDNLVTSGAALTPDSPFLDFTIEMTPDEAPFFSVEFPHSSHTLFLGCSSCHPGVREWKVPMERILAGQACGQCHGKVSFAPETSCARCHTNLKPPEESLVDADFERAIAEPVPASDELLARGAALYGQYCGFCHGDAGDGNGRLASWLTVKPRDFTDGTYKFRSTAGPLPRDEDLFKTITRGVPGTSMPAWSILPYEDRWALVHYVKSFSDWFAEEEPEAPLAHTESPLVTPELLAQGEDLYTGAGCSACHGAQGGGDGPSAKSLKDKWGQLVPPYNFASGRPLKSGVGPRDIFRIVMTGIGGTPMPAFGESLTPQQVWSLAHFVTSLRGTRREPFAVKGDIIFQRGVLNGSNGDQAPSGDDDGDFWGDEEAGGDDDGGFWGDEAESGDDDGGFWGDEVAAGDDAGDDGGGFWGDEEVAGDDAGDAGGDGGGFWGEEEVAGDDTGDDGGGFWGDEVAEDEGDDAGEDGGGFWGDEVAEDDGGGDSFWGEEEGGPPSADASLSMFPAESEAQPEVPPATFPHWLHRIRLKCANCHPRVFQMKAGANPINMDAMRAGLYCAKCHNGEVAWQIGFTNCPQCHQAQPKP